MPIIQADRLTRISAALLKAAGASDEEASAVAVGCVNANLAGHDSHGIIAVPIMAVMMLLATDSRVLGKFTVRRWLKVAGWLAMATMAAAVAAMLML